MSIPQNDDLPPEPSGVWTDADGIPLIHDGEGFIDEVEWLERGGHG